MATLSSEERAKIVANNKSLRLIKNELEGLAERGIVSDEQFDTIMAALPAEAPLRASTRNSTASPAPISSPPPEISSSLAAMHIQPLRTASAGSEGTNITGTTAATPAPSTAFGRAPPPPLPQRKAELSHAIAQYAYSGADAGDLSLERGDSISVTEYVNADWWSGTNVRTGKDGIFPRTYVEVKNWPSTLAAQNQNRGQNNAQGQGSQNAPNQRWDEKPPAMYGGPVNQFGGGGYPGQPVYDPYASQQPQSYGQPNPYNSSAPPMAMANQPEPEQQQQQPGKGQAMAKKFGSKLGNAAIFGAGATMGGDLVNSIF